MRINTYLLVLGSLLGMSFLLFVLSACHPKTNLRPLAAEEVVVLERSQSNNTSLRCESLEGYDPGIYKTPKRTIRVNFHFMNCADSTANYSEDRGMRFAKAIVNHANRDLKQNQPMHLPLGNTTPTYPINYKYVLTPTKGIPGDKGVYFHYDDDLYYFIHKGRNRNSPNKEVINKYCVSPDSVLNVFVMPHHPDSVTSKSYNQDQTGIALGTSIKIAGILERGKYQPWFFRGLLNHEIGHVLGIHHTWRSNDGCDDTPKNPNCWNKTHSGRACDSLYSNNVMDYNSAQNAWTPCQLSKVHRNFAKLGSRQRKLLIPNWCQLDTTYNAHIRDSVHWAVARDLSGHVVVHEGGVLTISCRTSFAKDAQLLVMPGGKLILDRARLHSDCGGQWGGIKIAETKKGKKGMVTFIGKPLIQDTSFDSASVGHKPTSN